MSDNSKPFGRFRVLYGVHAEGGKVYRKGDIVESASDLLKHNIPGQAPRYGSLDDVVPTESREKEETEAYEEMTFAELKSYAEEGEIDITGATTKAQLIQKIRAAEE